MTDFVERCENEPMTSFRVAADIGGTFTDLVVEPSEGPVMVGKVPTTPDDPARGVVEGLLHLVPDPSEVAFFVHGTTVGLNAFLERKGERVLLVTTAGHRDGYTIARGNRRSLYELRYRKPELLVPRRDVHEVRGRLAWNGDVIEPLRTQDFDLIVDKAKSEGIRAIAVCFLHSFAFPDHEIEAGELLRTALPQVSVSLSHEVAREWREYERASSVVMNAYVSPVVRKYLTNLESDLSSRGMAGPVHVMQSNGGVITATSAKRNPVFTLLSGPVGGAIGGSALAETLGRPNLLCVDMGGTSFDLSLVVEGLANTALEAEIEGLPLLMSSIDIKTIGTGGGSIASLHNGTLRVGPQSAGSDPGPACYGNGGQEPTVTDANLYLNRRGERSLLGGEMRLHRSASTRAIERLAQEAGLMPGALAEGILAISNAAMADAMRTITVGQGVDPREFALVAFGGAGPMAATFLAEELDIAEVLVPRFPGAFSAWGMLQTDLRRDFVSSFFRPLERVDEDEAEAVFSALQREGDDAISDEGVRASQTKHARSADMRYAGQEYTINVPAGVPMLLDEMLAKFHEGHLRRYGHSSPNAQVEFVNLRVSAIGTLPRPGVSGRRVETDARPARTEERQTVFDGHISPTPVLWRDHLPERFQASGPVIVEERSATTVIPPGWLMALDPMANIVIRKPE